MTELYAPSHEISTFIYIYIYILMWPCDVVSIKKIMLMVKEPNTGSNDFS